MCSFECLLSPSALPEIAKSDKSQIKLLQIVEDRSSQSYGEDCNIILLVRYQRSCPQKRFSQHPKLQEQVVAFEAQSVLCSSACGATL